MLAGGDSDDLVAQQLGAASAGELSGAKGEYREAIKRKLEEVGAAFSLAWPLGTPSCGCLAWPPTSSDLSASQQWLANSGHAALLGCTDLQQPAARWRGGSPANWELKT
jgi:hypothetical protein